MHLKSIAVLAVFPIALASTANGQASTSISAGVTMVRGPASVWAGQGYHFQVGKEFGSLGGQIRFRVDGLYSQSQGNGSSYIERAYALTTIAIGRGPGLGIATPYALAGVGLYGYRSWAYYTPGLNGGIGVELLSHGRGVYAEARVHQFWRPARDAPKAGTGVTLVPLSFGIRY